MSPAHCVELNFQKCLGDSAWGCPHAKSVEDCLGDGKGVLLACAVREGQVSHFICLTCLLSFVVHGAAPVSFANVCQHEACLPRSMPSLRGCKALMKAGFIEDNRGPGTLDLKFLPMPITVSRCHDIFCAA